MANIKISELTALTPPDAADLVPVVDIDASATKKATVSSVVVTGSKALARGSESAPAVAFGGATDANTGIYSPGADQVAISTNGTGRLFVNSAGNVGIGTTSDPSGSGSRLWIDTTSDTYFTANTTGSGNLTGIHFRNSNGNGEARISNNTGGALTFYNSSSNEAARIDSSGRLLVGTSSQVGGNLLQTAGQLGLIQTAATNQINFYGTGIEFVNRNATARQMSFYVGGSGGAPVATLTTAGVWTDASDISNKTNVEEIQYGIETVKSLLPRQYDVVSDGTHAIGFVAQEVQNVIPEVVTSTIAEDGTEFLGLAYGQLTAVLTKALQEAIGEIESLKARVAALESA